MANTQGPFGFQQIGTASGAPNFARAGSGSPYRIKSTFTTAIFFGDAVRMWVSGDSGTGAAGYITPWVNGDGAGSATKILAGIFQGCEYYSLSQRQSVWSRYYPGSDAGGDVTAYVCDDPTAQFEVQAGAAAVGYSAIGQAVDAVVTTAGSTSTGYSGMYLDVPTTTSTLPFKVVNLKTTPPGSPGADVTAAYNTVIVAFNNQLYKQLAGV